MSYKKRFNDDCRKQGLGVGMELLFEAIDEIIKRLDNIEKEKGNK